MKTHFHDIGGADQIPGSRNAGRDGFVLPMVLMVAAFALMLGLGRLVLFRAQTQLRIDRQREIHHVLATRSAMRWLETRDVAELPAEPRHFDYSVPDCTLGVSLCPVVPIFPAPGNLDHFSALRDASKLAAFNYISATIDSEALKTIGPAWSFSPDGNQQIILGDDNAPTGRIGRIEIDVPAAATLWTDDVYGRRYGLSVNEARKGGEKDGLNYPGDLIRMYVTPKGVSVDNAAWVVWLERDHDSDEDILVSLCWREPSGAKTVCGESEMKSEGRCGIQISGSGAVLYDKKTTGTNKNVGLATHTFTVFELPLELVSYFQDPPHGDGVRLTLEVQTRCPDFDSKAVLVNAFGAIEVEPAYEYYTRIQWPDNSGTNLSEVSTVIRFDPYVHGSSSGSTTEKAFTYDTHGTTLRRR